MYDCAEALVRLLAQRALGLSRSEVSCLVVAMYAPPLGVRWVGCPVGTLAKAVRKPPAMIAAAIAEEAEKWLPRYGISEVVAQGPFVNMRWA